MKLFFLWINSHIEFLTLAITFLVAIITLISTLITRKMLLLNSQPTLKIEAQSISISPEITKNIKKSDLESIVDNNKRYWLSIKLKVINIGNNPAQDICLDADVTFVKRKPCGYNVLPIHLPRFINVLPPESVESSSTLDVSDTSVCFDNYVAREIVKDFFQARENSSGLPVLPTANELKNSSLWHSPKISIKCFYSDIQGFNYCTILNLFFHIYYDEKEGKMDMNLLNMFDHNYLSVRRISKWDRIRYFKKARHLRYTAFDGVRYEKDDLLLLFASKKGKSIKNKS